MAAILSILIKTRIIVLIVCLFKQNTHLFYQVFHLQKLKSFVNIKADYHTVHTYCCLSSVPKLSTHT